MAPKLSVSLVVTGGAAAATSESTQKLETPVTRGIAKRLSNTLLDGSSEKLLSEQASLAFQEQFESAQIAATRPKT